MERTGLIKAFGKNVSRKKKIVGSYLQKNQELVFPKEPVRISIKSNNKNDFETGRGARKILINGLDKNYKEFNEIVIVGEKSRKYFFRINNLIVVKYGDLKFNQGDIIAYNKYNLYHVIGKEENLSCCGIYTVPRGYNWQMTRFNLTAECSIFNDITINVYMKPKIFGNLEIVEIYLNKYNCNVNYPIEYATIVGEMTDISITAKKRGFFNAKFGCYYQFKLIKIKK